METDTQPAKHQHGTSIAPHEFDIAPLDRSPRLLICCGSRKYAVRDGDRLHIGRSQLCTIRIPGDLRVSRVHCVVSAANGNVFVQDLGSSNGTFVNEQQVGRAPQQLLAGNVINIGDTILPAMLPYDERSAAKPR